MKTILIAVLFFVPLLPIVSQQPVISSKELVETGPGQRRDLSIPGSRIVINPYDFSKDPETVSALSYSTGKALPLQLAYLSTRNQYPEQQRMGRVLKEVLNCWLQDKRTLLAADTVLHEWSPHALHFRADYRRDKNLEGYDFFYDESVVVRHLQSNRPQKFVIAGKVPETAEQQGNSLLLLSRNTCYAIAFSEPFRSITYYSSEADLKARRHPLPAAVKNGWWAAEFAAAQELETAIAFGETATDTTGLVQKAVAAAQREAVNEAYARRELYWDDFLAGKVPHPENFRLTHIDDKGIDPAMVRLTYYKAWVFLAQNLLKPDPQLFPYYQVTAGKASLWDEGEPAAPFSATWESLVGMQLYALIDPQVSWNALKGLLSLVDETGMLGGESLPSRKAQTAWMLFQLTRDHKSLQEVYPALKRYMNWRRAQPRWIYKDATPENEKDAEFVVSALLDMQAMARIATELGLSADKDWWKKEETALSGEYLKWFWASPDALPVQHINHRPGRDSYPIQITSGLVLEQLSGPHLQSMLQLFNNYFDTSRSFAGFEAPKYPDMDYTIYGLIGKGQSARAQVLVEANIRDVIRSGWFAETYFHKKGKPVPGGVRPSLFGMAQVISFLLLKNGYVFDRGDPYAVGLFTEDGGVSGIHYRHYSLNLRLRNGGRTMKVSDGSQPLIDLPLSKTELEPVFGQAYYTQEAHQVDWYARAIAHAGDATPFHRLFRKIAGGDTITIGAIGGSITAGAAASDFNKTSYVALVADWFRKQFPQARFRLINAGIGATNSVYGVHRVDSDLLNYRPDLVLVEFSVNDRSEPEARESYEGLLRKILQSSQQPAVITIGLMDEKGNNWQNHHLPLSRHYQLPYISYRDALWPEISRGAIAWRELSPDEVHPNDRGHAYIAGLVTAFLHKKRSDQAAAEKISRQGQLPVPLTKNRYERSGLLLPSEFQTRDLGVFALTHDGWQSNTKGSPLVLDLEAGCIWVNYLRTNKGNGGKVAVFVDGKQVQQLDANFPGGWGDYIQATRLIRTDKPGRHRVSFQPLEAGKTFCIRNLLLSAY